MVKLAHICNFWSCLDDLQNITIKVFFPWQEKNDSADVGLSSGWRRDAFVFLSL